MKNVIATVMVLLASTNALAMSSLPNGNYEGKGRSTDQDGKTGAYTVKVNVANNVVDTNYSFDGQTKGYAFQADLDKNGFFTVKVNGAEVGHGYCLTAQCHYSLSYGETTVEETLTFYQDHLYKLGSKVVNGKRVAWEEWLEAKK